MIRPIGGHDLGHHILNVTGMLRPRVIHFVGPGGAGKSTVGHALAGRLGVAFIDLDDEFKARGGDITTYMNANGYQAYARQNMRSYMETLGALQEEAVIALSSGFTTYDPDIHAGYLALRGRIATNPTTFVLLPSLDYEVCVRETVRRCQLTRSFSRSAEREEEVIRHRFETYEQLPATKVATIEPIDAVVGRLLTLLRHTTPSPLQ
jgi:shikimate kinase